MATSKANIDAWAKLGNHGWNWPTMEKYFKKSYTLSQPSEVVAKHLKINYLDDSVRGTEGPIQASFPEVPDNRWPGAWVETLERLGFPMSGDPFSGQAYGAYVNAESIHPATKQRSYSANAYLEPVRGRPNLTVLTGAPVEKLIMDESDLTRIIVEGAQYRKDGMTRIVKARKEIILSAGAFNSPKLLELSGIGGAKLLQQLQVPVLIDNPNVGENLQNHIMCGMSFEVTDGLQTLDPLSRQEPAALAAAAQAYSKQGGPFANGGSFASALLPVSDFVSEQGREDLSRLLHSLEIDLTPDTHSRTFDKHHEAFVHSILTSSIEASGCYISFPGYSGFTPEGSFAPPPQNNENYFTIAVLLSYPLSRGSVHISSSSPSTAVRLDPHYLSHPLDIEILARHVRYADSVISNAEPLRSLLKANGKRNQDAPTSLKNLDVAKKYVRHTAVGAHHPTSTCAMLPREMGGVVSDRLVVYGCANLRVCDASVIPIIPRGNPQATVYAVAERAADIIKEDWNK